MLRRRGHTTSVAQIDHRSGPIQLHWPNCQAFPALQEVALAKGRGSCGCAPVGSGTGSHFSETVRRGTQTYGRQPLRRCALGDCIVRRNGPPFTCLGRMVTYSMTGLEDHMRAGWFHVKVDSKTAIRSTPQVSRRKEGFLGRYRCQSAYSRAISRRFQSRRPRRGCKLLLR
jgi:hypothetical protein